MTYYYSAPLKFIEQGEHVAAEIRNIHDSIGASSVDSIKCKLIISMELYSIQSGISENVHRTETLFSNLAHTNALFLSILFVLFVSIIFAIFQMASAYEDNIPHNNPIEIEGASIKIKTGYVSLAVAMISMIALSLYLPNAHEVKLLPDSKTTVITFDVDNFFDFCAQYINVK
ncbi:hypothetical protein [Microbaculum marinum]|uniref:Uncharacterized protein n=1 Tax=Microbaculum marinum TaxID=1764581 RepID=A0AAW9RQB0_9HYPH